MRMLVLQLKLTGQEALAECQRRGLVVGSHRELAGRPGSDHWHLKLAGHAGTLELSQWQDRVWVQVHPRRQGTWTTRLAHELAVMPGPVLPGA